MKRVEAKKYRTPSLGNLDCQWSVGVLNLTEAEADMIVRYANGIRSVNSSRALGVTTAQMASGLPTAPAAQKVALNLTEADMIVRQRAFGGGPDRVRYANGILVQDERPEPEVEMPRNRFSGLDIE